MLSQIEQAEERRQQLLQDLDQRRRERNQLEARRGDLLAALDGAGLEERGGLETQIGGVDAALQRLNEVEAVLRFEFQTAETRLRALRTDANNQRVAIKEGERDFAYGKFDMLLRQAQLRTQMIELEIQQHKDALLAAYSRLARLEGEPAARSLAAKHGRDLP